MATTFPDIAPSKSSPGQEVTFDVLSAMFGDGYEQRAAAGTNGQRSTWTLTWENVVNDDADTIENFLDATGGYQPFWWTAPRDTEVRLWILDGGYSVGQIESTCRTVSAKFKRYFGAAT
jgi:phage-related protein